jgi:hydrogenase nickel incorporation protein HypA/HybF
MHELSVTESILEIALRHGNAANAKRITNIYLVIGQLSSIIDDSVQFYWDIVSKSTLAESAQLHFRRIPTELHCQECNFRYPPKEGDLTCQRCGSSQVNVVAGTEFYLEAIDVET